MMKNSKLMQSLIVCVNLLLPAYSICMQESKKENKTFAFKIINSLQRDVSLITHYDKEFRDYTIKSGEYVNFCSPIERLGFMISFKHINNSSMIRTLFRTLGGAGVYRLEFIKGDPYFTKVSGKE